MAEATPKYEFQVIKSTCTGESVIVKGEAEKLEDITKVYEAVDARMVEMNRRYSEALDLDAYFPPQYRGAFKMILDAFWKGSPEQIPGTVPVPKDHWKKYGPPKSRVIREAHGLDEPAADAIGEPQGTA